MNKILILITAIVFLTLRAALDWFSTGIGHRSAIATPATGSAVVELFTSEGCSSCPPADELAARISREYDQHVFVLSFHIDYWNYLGWKDAFSQPAFTRRQQKYGSHFKLSSIYTPQMIVNGKTELVGSNEPLLIKTIKQELALPMASVIQLTIDTTDKLNLAVAYKTEHTQNEILHLALVQLQAVTNVTQGENAGHQLQHTNVVRDLQSIPLQPSTSGIIRFHLPQGLATNDVAVIAFTQDKNNMAITGVGELSIK